MASLPITCSACGRQRYHYSHCECPDGRLWWIDQQRGSLKRRLKELDDEECDVLGLKHQAVHGITAG